MQLKEFDVLLDIKKQYKGDRFEVVQGDSHSNVLNITLIDGLNHFNLSNTNVEIVFSKSDGTTVQQTDAAIINETQGRIQCVLKTNTIASPGKVVAEVRVLENETLLTSARFEFYVRKSLITDETIESTDEFPILMELIDAVKDITEQVPEEVVNNLNNLTTYVNGLAGLGRTNETVKDNADSILSLIEYIGNLDDLETETKLNIVLALNEIYNDLATHKAENVSNGVHGLGSIAGQVYQEGIWTPELKFGGNSVGMTYSQQTGKFKRIGNIALVEFAIILSNKGSSVGNAEIEGLPINTANANPNNVGDIISSNVNIGTKLSILVGNNQSKFGIRKVTSTALGNATDSDFANNSSLWGFFIYSV